ncbi:MAG: hypothetical protein AABY22_29850 [Nanoarchaeota archaeon]
MRIIVFILTLIMLSSIVLADSGMVDKPIQRPCLICNPPPSELSVPTPPSHPETRGSSTQRVFSSLDSDLTLKIRETKDFYIIKITNIGLSKSEDMKLYVNFLYEKSIIYFIDELQPLESALIYQEKEGLKPIFTLDPYYESHDLNYHNNQVIM